MQGYIVVITRNGSLGGRYPLTSTECLFGQSPICDVRVYVANVARKHCLITAQPNERAYIRNLSPSSTTLVNGIQIGTTQCELQHADVITVGDRHFRWEYPVSYRQKTPARKTMDSEVHKTPTCMVQVPMSVFKKKRHSSPGVLRENKIISITSQDGVEPDPKRRKTLHSVTDLVMENKLVKPVNKQLMAVTQPASKPKSFNTFKVLLKSASKRSSLIPISKTPKPQKKVISSKIHRSKSFSPQKLSPKQKTLQKYSQKSVKKSEQVEKVLKLSIPSLKPVAKKLSLSTPLRKSISTVTKKSPFKNSPAEGNSNSKRKSIATVALTNKTPNQSKSPKCSPKSRTPKNSPPRKFTPLVKSLSPKTSLSTAMSPKSPGNSSIKQSQQKIVGSPSRKNITLSTYHSPKATRGSTSISNKTPVKTQCGRSKTPQSSPTRKSVSPIKPLSLGFTAKDNIPSKTPGGRIPKTPEGSPARKTLSQIKSPSNTSRNSSPSKKKTSSKSPRGRLLKTPEASSSRKYLSPVKSSPKSGSPVKDKTPGRTPRGRPLKTPTISSARKSASPVILPPKTSRSSSPPMDKTSGKTLRGRPKTSQASPTRKSTSPVTSPFLKTSRSGSPVKDRTPDRTPRGRPLKILKTSSVRKSISPVKFLPSKVSQSSSPVMDETSGRSPRGRSKTLQASPIRKSVSPAKSPSLSSLPLTDKTSKTTPSFGKPNTPQASLTRKSVLSLKSPSSKTSRSGSPVMNKSPDRTSRGRPSKSPQASTSKSVYPIKSPMKTPESRSLVKEKTPGRTSRGRQTKTPQFSPARKSTSPEKLPEGSCSSSPEMAKTAGKTSRGRPSKTSRASPTRKSVSPAKPPSPNVFGNSLLVKTPSITLRGRSFKTPQTSPSKSPTSGTTPTSGSEVETLVKSPRSDVPLDNSYLREDELFVKTPKAPKLSDKSPTGKSAMKRVQESGISSPQRFISDQSFGRATNNETQALGNVTKSARRSALRSGLSSSKDLTTSLNKPLLIKSSIKKAEIVKLQIDSKRKYDTDAEAKAERAAKRLKMETPKSLTKNKKAALLVCHSPKSQKRPLFSEVLKSHLSTVKKNQAAAAVHSVVAKRAVKQISYKAPLSLELPKSFKFNSTGHANSPETIIISKKFKNTPAPKTRKGRKSTSQLKREETRTIDNNLEGVLELFKTPKSIVSSLRNASSVKKSQNVRVRFSLQNDVQSPSGRRSFVMHSDEATHFGSPMISCKKYVGTPRPPRRTLNDTSLIHTSIMEESPLAQEIDASEVHISPSETSDKSYDFSAYSPSSPTLQFSKISDVSSVFARSSIDFVDSPASESSKESPKRKRSTRTPNNSLSETSPSSSKRFSFASASSNRSRNSPDFQPSPDSCAIFSQSDLNVSSPVNSYQSQESRVSGISIRSKEDIANISQIPLPHSPLRSSSRLASQTLSSFKSFNRYSSMRSTRSSNTDITSNTSLVESPQRKKSIVQQSLTGNRITSAENSPSSQSPRKTNQALNLSVSSDNSTVSAKLPKRISSTPKLPEHSDINSPISSPIFIFDRRSLRSLGLPSPQNFMEESSKDTAIIDDQSFNTSLPTPGKKPRKGCNRMNASNAEMITPESQVPVAAVKPSTRRKQGNESYSSASESVSLPAFSVSHDISGRSVDRSLAQKIMDSRTSSGLDKSTTSRSTTSSLIKDESNLSLGSLSLSRRKRKSSASSSIQSIDATTFDFSSAITPKIPREMFVSPLDKVNDDLTNISGVKRILSPKGNSPVSSYEDVRGIKRLLKTPKEQNDLTNVTGVKRVMSPKANSPISSYIDVKGVKRLLKTPQSHSPLANYTNIEGIKELFKHSPVADYTNVAGVKSLYSASAEPNYMNVKGVRRIFKETKVPNSPDIAGVEVLFESPKKLMDEYNQSPSSKPIGMVPPMSREVSDIKTSGDSTTETVDNAIEGNQPVTRNTEYTSRRRALGSKKLADKQIKSNTSVSLRKSKRTNADLQVVCKAAIQSTDSGKKNSRQVNQANVKNVEELSTDSRITHASQMGVDEQKFIGDKPRIETAMENEVRITRKSECKQLAAEESIKDQMNLSEITTQPSVGNNVPENTRKRKEVNQPITRSPKKENQDISLNNKTIVGRRTRQTLRQAKAKSAKISELSNKEESNEEESRSKVNKNDKENPLLAGRKTRGRSRRSPKEGDILDLPCSVPKSKMLIVQENVQSPNIFRKTIVTENRNKIKGLDTAEVIGIQIATGSSHGKVNVTSNIDVSNEKSDTRYSSNIESELDGGAKRNIHSRGVKGNKEKATSPEPTVVPVESPTYSENKIKERRGRGRPVRRKAQEAKSPEMSLELSKTTSRRRKTDSSQGSANKLSLERNNNLRKGDLNRNSELSLSIPSTSQTSSFSQDDCKKTSRRVKFDMKSPPLPKKSPKKRAAKKTADVQAATSTMASKSEYPTSSVSPKKRVPAKKIATKTKATPKLKAAAKTDSPASSTSPKNRVTAKKVATKAKATPKLKAAAKTESPVPSASPKNRVPAKKVAAKTKAIPKLKAAAKVASPTSTNNSPEKKEPTKRKTRQAKASLTLETVAMTASPTSKDNKSKIKVSTKKATSKTKASPKLKAATKRKSYTPVKSPPAKRITRSRK